MNRMGEAFKTPVCFVGSDCNYSIIGIDNSIVATTTSEIWAAALCRAVNLYDQLADVLDSELDAESAVDGMMKEIGGRGNPRLQHTEMLSREVNADFTIGLMARE